jgi:hypothetical protein
MIAQKPSDLSQCVDGIKMACMWCRLQKDLLTLDGTHAPTLNALPCDVDPGKASPRVSLCRVPQFQLVTQIGKVQIEPWVTFSFLRVKVGVYYRYFLAQTVNHDGLEGKCEEVHGKGRGGGKGEEMG